MDHSEVVRSWIANICVIVSECYFTISLFEYLELFYFQLRYFTHTVVVNCQHYDGLLGAGSSSGLSHANMANSKTHGGQDNNGAGETVVGGLLGPTVQPKFMSRGHLYKAVVGDTIELPCKVQNLGETRDVLNYNAMVNNVYLAQAPSYFCGVVVRRF